MPPVSYWPDVLFWEGAFREHLVLEVDAQGLISGVSPASSVSPSKNVRRLAGRALLPGLVNGHSHAFQRLIRGGTEHATPGHERDDFWSWRELMYRAAERLAPEEVYVASRQAFVEMALAGITTVGEFHYLHHQPDGTPYSNPLELADQVIRAALDVGIRITLLRVGYARSGFNVAENPRQRRFKDRNVEGFLQAITALQSAYAKHPHVRVGCAPHSVRAVPKSWLGALSEAKLPCVHMHVAEQREEIDACVAEHQRRPVQLLKDLGLLGPHFTAVHAIHLADDEVQALGASESFVCACPTTEMNLGDGVIAADHLLAQGARVTLGSDSQARIDLLEEARSLEGHLRLVRERRNVLDPRHGQRDGLARRLFDMATVQGSQSLGHGPGTLSPGAPADFFTVSLNHPSLVGIAPEHLLAAIVFGSDKGALCDTVVGGRDVVVDGRHSLQDQSGREFSALVRRLLT